MDYLIINRSKWRTGSQSLVQTGVSVTALLNGQGHMCCLGFRCHQMGIPKKQLLNKSSPYDLSYNWTIPDLLDQNGYSNMNSDFTNEAMSINDDSRTTPQQKEEFITNHFATIGVTVEFIGKY